MVLSGITMILLRCSRGGLRHFLPILQHECFDNKLSNAFGVLYKKLYRVAGAPFCNVAQPVLKTRARHHDFSLSVWFCNDTPSRFQHFACTIASRINASFLFRGFLPQRFYLHILIDTNVTDNRPFV